MLLGLLTYPGSADDVTAFASSLAASFKDCAQCVVAYHAAQVCLQASPYLYKVAQRCSKCISSAPTYQAELLA